MLRLAYNLVTLALILAILVVLLGAWTRISEAGLSCPDWPGCYGYMFMPVDQEQLRHAQIAYPDTPIELSKISLEMGHRYLAGGLGLLVVGLTYIAFRLRNVRDYPAFFSYALLFLIVLQAIFGMWTVTWKLYPPVVTTHLMGGMLTLAMLITIRRYIRHAMEPSWKKKTSLPLLIKAGLAVLLMQIALGGWTSSNYAGPACSHWFSCNPKTDIAPDFKMGFQPMITVGPNYQGGYLPVEARAAIQIIHRLGAMSVVAVCLLLFIKFKRFTIANRALYGLLMLLSIQLALGMMNVMWAVPPLLAFLHHAVAVFMLILTFYIGERINTVKKEWCYE